MFSRSVSLVCAAVLALALAAGAQQPGGEMRAIPLGIYRYDGGLTPGLEVRNINVKGVRGRVTRVAADSAPRRIVLLLDTSGSMNDRHKWRQAIGAARVFVRTAPPGTNLAGYTFAEEITALADAFAASREALDSALAGLLPADKRRPAQVQGQTWLIDALHHVLNGSEAGLRSGDTIVLVSDGQFQEEEVSFKSVLRTLSARCIRVYWLMVLTPEETSLIRTYGAGRAYDTGKLVEETGGLAFEVWSNERMLPEHLRSDERYLPVMQWAHRTIRSFYRVELELEEPLRKPKKLKLEIRDADGKKLPDEALAYPRHLLPLSRQP